MYICTSYMKNLFYILLFTIFWVSCHLTKSSKSHGANEQPNIILIFIDDMGYADITPFGAKNYKTPNIDKLAKEGMKFTDFYASQAVCSASRASLMTGCYAERVGISGALMPWAKIGLNEKEVTIAELLKEQGYKTAIFGKWHLGHHKRFLPLQHGFDEYVGLPYSNDMWPVDYDGTPLKGTGKRKAGFPPLTLYDGNDVIDTVKTLEDQAELTGIYTAKAIDFIKRNKDRPFFLYIPHSMVHVPIAASQRFKGKSGKGLFADVVMELDWSVGEIMKTLEKEGLDKNTLVIFTSDNGPWLNFGNHAGSAFPLREGKGTMWEGGPRVPTIMRWLNVIPQGSTTNKIGSTIDILPTIAEITNSRLPDNKIDGVSLLPVMRGDKDANPRKMFFYYYDKSLIAIRKGKWKLVFPHSGRTYKGFEPGKDGYPGKTGILTIEKPELYDLENDIGETKDISSQHAEIVKKLMVIGDSIRLELGDRITNTPGKGVRKPGRIENNNFIRVKNIAKGKNITVSAIPGFEYRGEGASTLINGILGSDDYKDGQWLGYQGQDIEVIIDLQKETEVNEIICRFLENQKAWIFLPETLKIQLSNNGKIYEDVKIFKPDFFTRKDKQGIAAFSTSNIEKKARFIKVNVYTYGVLPEWHLSHGQKSWIFIDEIQIR